MIDSRGGIIEPREEREGGEALRSSKQKREFNICKLTQTDATPVQTARASARIACTHTRTRTHSHLLAAMLEAHPNENILAGMF